jgi:hypothetical protein
MKLTLYAKGAPRSEPAPARIPPSKEEVKARKAKQAEDGVLAMAEYEQHQRATLEKTARLRAERLARDVKKVHAATTRALVERDDRRAPAAQDAKAPRRKQPRRDQRRASESRGTSVPGG